MQCTRHAIAHVVMQLAVARNATHASRRRRAQSTTSPSVEAAAFSAIELPEAALAGCRQGRVKVERFLHSEALVGADAL